MTDKKYLYCCSSYYQLLVSLMKALTQGQQIDLVLEEHGMETASQLAEKLTIQMSNCVGQVFVCPNCKNVDPYLQRCASFLPWQRRQILHHMAKVFAGMDVTDLGKYKGIHVFWDLGYAGTYFNICHIHYTLHEDSLNSYQHIRKNRPNYSYLFRKKGWKFRLKKYFHIGVIPFGYSDCCDMVEVNEKAGIEIPKDKVKEVSRAELEKQLTKAQKKQIFDLFMAGVILEAFLGNESMLLLTEPFAVTGRLPSQEAQLKLYRDVIKLYAGKRQVLIKPHPRDKMDYRKYFSDARIIEKNIPMEVLNFDENFQVSRAVTVTSSAIQGIHCAEEKICLGRDFLLSYTLSNEV